MDHARFWSNEIGISDKLFTYSFSTSGSMEWGSVMDVVVVNTLGWLESHVVVTWVVVLPESSGLCGEEQWAGISTNNLKRK